MEVIIISDFRLMVWHGDTFRTDSRFAKGIHGIGHRWIPLIKDQ